MRNIESSPHPLVFKVEAGERTVRHAGSRAGCISLRTSARALEGMQKEAIVENPSTGSAWRMVCDEGPFSAMRYGPMY